MPGQGRTGAAGGKAISLRVDGTDDATELPEPKYGPGKCTYDAYPLPQKRKRDIVSDNVEDALKKVKNVFK